MNLMYLPALFCSIIDVHIVILYMYIREKSRASTRDLAKHVNHFMESLIKAYMKVINDLTNTSS